MSLRWSGSRSNLKPGFFVCLSERVKPFAWLARRVVNPYYEFRFFENKGKNLIFDSTEMAIPNPLNYRLISLGLGPGGT
jgi:hypothetical protein